MNPETYQQAFPVASTIEKIAPHMTPENHILWVSAEQQHRCEGHLIAEQLKQELPEGDVVIFIEMTAEDIRKLFVKAIEGLNTIIAETQAIYLFHLRPDVFDAIQTIYSAGEHAGQHA